MQPVSLLFHDVFARDPGESGFCSPAADRYKLSLGEFDSQLNALRRENGHDQARLTFDDGGASYYSIVADKLEAWALRAYCFVATDFIGRSGFLTRSQIRELDARGHLIGTHSASHPARFNRLSQDEMLHEWTVSRAVLEDLLGHSVTAGSVPGGYFSKAVARAAAQAGLQLLFNSEPVKATRVIDGCTVSGRFTIRRGAAPDLSGRFVRTAPWARGSAWASWNAKGLVKPLLGSSYPRVADWIYGGAR
jgi:peptidoglycan/xylan/chitin deacetylase (PgdA/CDA1 family)